MFNFDETDDIPKYRKERKRIPIRKSRHKHIYERCIEIGNEFPALVLICLVCGHKKIEQSLIFSKVTHSSSMLVTTVEEARKLLPNLRVVSSEE